MICVTISTHFYRYINTRWFHYFNHCSAPLQISTHYTQFTNLCTMFSKVALIVLFVGSVSAFWDADSDNYRDSRVDDYRDYNSNYDLYDNDDSDDFYKNRLFMGGLGRRTWGQQRSFGFQPRRRQQVSRFNMFNRRSRNSGFRRPRPTQNLWSAFQTQPQSRFQSRSRFNRPTQSFRSTTQNFFQPQRNVFGGKNNVMRFSYYELVIIFLYTHLAFFIITLFARLCVRVGNG